MKKLILSLFSLFSVFAGVPHCLGNPAPEEVRASQPNRERRHGAYSKDNWTVYYEGRKVKGASASSFTDLGGGYGKDDWTVFYRGRKVEGASASSFESLGNGMGKDTGIPTSTGNAMTGARCRAKGWAAVTRRTAGRCITAAGRWTGRRR